MPQVQICSYCHLMQHAARKRRSEITSEDIERYLVHLRVEHGVILAAEIQE
jgi:hypothetical protein